MVSTLAGDDITGSGSDSESGSESGVASGAALGSSADLDNPTQVFVVYDAPNAVAEAQTVTNLTLSERNQLYSVLIVDQSDRRIRQANLHGRELSRLDLFTAWLLFVF